MFQVAQFDFANPLSIKSQTGTGWIPSEDGIHVEYTIKHKDKADALVKEPFGISSIKTIACKNELHKSDNVLMTSHLVLQMLDVSVQDMTLHLLKSLQVFQVLLVHLMTSG